MDNLFDRCRTINDLLLAGESDKARDELILTLDQVHRSGESYTPLLNHLIREIGLYPYLKDETCIWQDRFVSQAFRVPSSPSHQQTLHREQMYLFGRLLRGEDIVVSAPTSFGKSFIVDAFIQLKAPANVMIIVPTIALLDETRRRLYKKFASKYTIVTTSEASLGDRNIFIFPAERSVAYLDKVPELDLFVVDEFYKASSNFDPDRAPELLRAILKLSRKARQRYFLAPNIESLGDSIFTEGMEFVNLLHARTVFLRTHEVFKKIKDEGHKEKVLVDILRDREAKTLVYAGTFSAIDRLSKLLTEEFQVSSRELVIKFAGWLDENYGSNWALPNLVRRGIGLHHGRLHRSLSQLQVRLFEERDGLSAIVSTSSIIEGVNTSAENVVVWRNRNGRARLDDFTYKNIVGRGGRMFRHFVGNAFILEKPPEARPTDLQLSFPNEMLNAVDDVALMEKLAPEQRGFVAEFKAEMYKLIERRRFDQLLRNNSLSLANARSIKKIASDMKLQPMKWRSLQFLNSNKPWEWNDPLFKILGMQNVAGTEYEKFVGFVRILSENWNRSIPELLSMTAAIGIGIDEFFHLERNLVFKLSALVGDVNELHKAMYGDSVDVSPFVFKASHAFLPPVVHQLEEYGLPRMISKKIHRAGLIDFEDESLNIQSAVIRLNEIGRETVQKVEDIGEFDSYILDFFFDGIEVENENESEELPIDG